MFAVSARLLTVAAFAIATPAFAADASDSGTSGDAPKKEKTICKRETNVGSRMPVKTCRTESEWKAEENRARDRFQNRDKED